LLLAVVVVAVTLELEAELEVIAPVFLEKALEVDLLLSPPSFLPRKATR